jgi:uncharacterized protein (DUF1800 family)
MNDTVRATEAASWSAYEPGADAPWDLRRVVHLHRRAGFAATWSEIQRDLKDGPAKSIDRLLKGTSRSQGTPEDFASFSEILADNADEPGRLKAWWMYRMLFGPDPLTERLTLMWHNHFATSLEKVRSARTMRKQNETFRQHARAPFAKLLDAALRDPALLEWLDAPSNRKGNPNENLARELMELFSMGVGHYTEKDVKEGARALTGWTVLDGVFREDDSKHDAGEKEVLGHKGKWKGGDLIRLVREHPATADRLAFRLCEQFIGEGPGDAARKELADGLRKHALDLDWGVKTVLRSRTFFAPATLGRRVQGPVDYVVGASRALEMFDPPPSTLLLGDWAARLGQDLFHPPNVGGWKGGRHWLSPGSMISRANFAASLVGGKLFQNPQPFDALALAKKHGRDGSPQAVLNFYADLLLGGAPSPRWRDRLLANLGGRAALDADTARRAVILVLASPEAQLA